MFSTIGSTRHVATFRSRVGSAFAGLGQPVGGSAASGRILSLASALGVAVTAFGSRSGFTPLSSQDSQMMILVMNNKIGLVEMEVAACFVAIAIVALTLMLGHTLWKSVADR
jgi:hypothetical protein